MEFFDMHITRAVNAIGNGRQSEAQVIQMLVKDGVPEGAAFLITVAAKTVVENHVCVN